MSEPGPRQRLLASSTLRRLGTLLPSGRWLLTGGSLRDRLLGRRSHDFDLVVLGDALEGARSLTEILGGTLVRLGNGPNTTWRVVSSPWQLDVWGVSGPLARDVRRRDFTVNALMWWLPSGPLVDLAGGVEDLHAGRLCLVDPANLRADPLRVLRGFRLAATHPELRLTGTAEEELARAAPGLQRVAGERVREELRLLARGDAAPRTLSAMLRLGILAPLTNLRIQAEPVKQELSALLAALGFRFLPLLRHRSELTPLPLVMGRCDEFRDSPQQTITERLSALGWPERRAAALANAAAEGEHLIPTLCAGNQRQLRERLVSVSRPLESLAWAAARVRAMDRDLPAEMVKELAAWWRRFAARRPPLHGSEIAELLDLPPGPARARAVRDLRAARARGEVRTAEQARRWLMQRHERY